jgi:TetR/AcrR family transcriptional repressor of multidrug resistance operon
MKALDRPAAIRRALRDLVADRGFHGASMSAVAEAAGVAAGTAYVHYASKDELVYATYLEIKQEMGELASAVEGVSGVEERYRRLWLAVYDHLAREPERARFLTQLEESPYYATAHQMVIEHGDRLMEIASGLELAGVIIPLPLEAIYLLTIGVAVRLVAAGIELDEAELDLIIDATLRSVMR